MDHRDAVDLLRSAPFVHGAPQRWADLGCGTGTFTRALAELLPVGSGIIAMDRDAKALAKVPDAFAGIGLTRHLGDFVHDQLPTGLDGILLANALHFVRDQAAFILRAGAALRPGGAFLLVEYDMDAPDPWVPHPMSFATLSERFKACGFTAAVRLADRPSIFGRARLYSVWVARGGTH